MRSGFAAVERDVASLKQQIAEIRQADATAREVAKTAVVMASDVGITLDDWQARALSTDAHDIMLLASRQAGKSTVAGVKAIHQAVYVPGSTTLIVSPTERQSKRLLRSVRKHYYKVSHIAPAVNVGVLSIELRNGSEIHALPGSEETIRGFSAVDLLILDEGARIPDELYNAVRPMLAVSNGSLMALSTAFGKRGWFYEEWATGEGWHREKVTAHDCPRIDRAWLERERAKIGEWWFSQEYLCEFLEGEDSLFSFDDINAALDNDLEPLFAGRLFA